MSIAKVYARAIDAGRFKEKDIPAKRKAKVDVELKALKEKKGGDANAESAKPRDSGKENTK